MINKKCYVKINKLFYVILIIIIVFIDVISKNWITQNIKLNEVKKIFFVLNFSHVHNYGAAFSFLSDQNGWQRWLLSSISTITILVITRMIINSKKEEIKKITSYSLIVAGAIGNLIDRVFYGFVIDFIDINFNDWHLATFNIADCSIFLGILILT